MEIFCIWEVFICRKTNTHYKAGYFYHIVPSKKLVFISWILEGWTADSTLERIYVDSNWESLDWYFSNVTARSLLPVREFIPNKIFIVMWVGNHFKQNA